MRAALRRTGELLVKVLGAFVILEPIWMLLPFAGFLYGSGLQIQSLSRHPETAWLTHFVFPILTLGFLGPALVVLGLVLFVAGAVQIYTAKIRKSGLVTSGLYRFVRHPQYMALVFFGLGILLVWGRAISYLAFFLMMFLYYYLAKSEEAGCRRAFGEPYEAYRERTSFLIPGDRLLRGLGARLPRFGLPAPVRVAAALALALAACFGSMWLINAMKRAARVVPFLTASVPLGAKVGRPPSDPGLVAEVSAGVPYVRSGRLAVVRGPYRNAAAPGFAERLALRLPRSKTLSGFLSFLEEPGGDAAIVFSAPYHTPTEPRTPGAGEGGERGPPLDPAGTDRVRLIILRLSIAGGARIRDAFLDRSKREIRGALIAPVNLSRPEDVDLVEGRVIRPGPGFPGEERWSFLLAQLAARGDAPADGGPALVPGRHAAATLLLVKAPILRTRIDPAFAEEIRDRLARSGAFADHLRKTGTGGEVLAVAFPRPGPNWYREHHGTPQISVFVMLVRPTRPGDDPATFFRSGERALLGAFTAELDFAAQPTADPVGEISTIGPRRDLEERWRFFLSGI